MGLASGRPELAFNMGDNFEAIFARVRQGDEEAARELVNRYEPQIRRVVRIRLTEPGLRRQFESIDVCQSVLGDFFVRAALGQFELETPEQLVALLAQMARNKLIQYVRRERAQRRDQRRVAPAPVDEQGLSDGSETPSQIVSARELLEASRKLLSDEERYLIDQRAAGRGWDDLARELNATPDGLRMRLNRAVQRVTDRLALEDGDEHA